MMMHCYLFVEFCIEWPENLETSWVGSTILISTRMPWGRKKRKFCSTKQKKAYKFWVTCIRGPFTTVSEPRGSKRKDGKWCNAPKRSAKSTRGCPSQRRVTVASKNKSEQLVQSFGWRVRALYQLWRRISRIQVSLNSNPSLIILFQWIITINSFFSKLSW